jgi:hypothetical protein
LGHYQFIYTATGSSIGDGIFKVTNATAKETQVGKTGPKTDSFAVLGNLALPGQALIAPASSGNWTIYLGNYVQAIPVSSLKYTKSSKTYQYTGNGVKTGITSFVLNAGTGGYSLNVVGLPSGGVDSDGLPETGDGVSRADVALSMNLALSGTTFQAGTYIRLHRNGPGTKKWTLR